MASGALAGMMSFGGLLKPLTRQGLGLSEIGMTLVNLMPVMSTYAFPVAALFATTLVYGKLASDNELTAMRAVGISHVRVAIPAIALGVIIFGLSLYMLCFVVPTSTLRVERIITANVARMLVSSIERTHEYSIKDGPVISAQRAELRPPDINEPGVQTVVLENPFIVDSYVENRPEGRIRIPRNFYSARKATLFMRPLTKSDDIEITIKLESGISFQRRLANAVTGGVAETQYGPVIQPLPLAEKPKFMDLHHLRQLYAEPDASKRVIEATAKVNRVEQVRLIFERLKQELGRNEPVRFQDTDELDYALYAPGGCTYRSDDRELTIKANAGSLLRYQATRKNNTTQIIESPQLVLTPVPDDEHQQIELSFTFDDASVRASASDEPNHPGAKFRRSIYVLMTPDISEIGTRTASSYAGKNISPSQRADLDRALITVQNEVIGELNARAAFAISCIVLVVMGCCLGMMFRSGHFLTAFGISVGPALICILLTVTGQHTLESIPAHIPPGWVNPIRIGTGMIWAGNAVVGTIAAVMLIRLQKQ
jgi:lipopolysaccharide export LptBFGC system permease protein LptF